MLRFLIVEDKKGTLDQLEQLLLESFEGADVDTARTVNEGTGKVNTAYGSGQDYDVTILDFRLPRDVGDDDKIDESLCRTVSLHMPNALIVHISSYGDDPCIESHCRNHKPRQGYPVLISKLNTDWASQLVDVIRKFVHSVRIDAKMDRLFRTRRGGGGAPYQGRRADVELPCMTPQLDDVMQDIVEHWDDVDASLRLRVAQVFELDMASTPPRIALRGIPRFGRFGGEENRHDA